MSPRALRDDDILRTIDARVVELAVEEVIESLLTLLEADEFTSVRQKMVKRVEEVFAPIVGFGPLRRRDY